VAVVEIEIKQLRNGLEALQIQSDAIRLDRANLEFERNRVEFERNVAISALSLALGKLRERQRKAEEAQKRLDGFMFAQLNALVAVDQLKEAVTVAENLIRELRNQEITLMGRIHRKLRFPTFGAIPLHRWKNASRSPSR